MRKAIRPLVGLVIALVIIAAIPAIGLSARWFNNRLDYAERKIDDQTRYETLKKVEDAARAMIANYTADALTYEQYFDSADAEKRGWAEQAKMRANKTAATYNEYVLKNSFIWEGNVPDDIKESLDYLE